MSLIHLEKSVLTFHLKEILEDGHGSHPLTWIGLGILIFGPKLLPTGNQPSRSKPLLPIQQSGHRQILLSQWIAEAQQRESDSQNQPVFADSARQPAAPQHQ